MSADGTHAALARIWTEVLDQQAPDATRDFFAAGGDSLRAMQLCARLSAQFGIQIPLRILFEAPTLAQFGERLALLQAHTNPVRDSILPPTGSMGALSHSQERMCFMHELALGSAAYHVPMAWRLRGRLDVPALRSAFAAVVARHDVLRTTVATVDGRLLPQPGSAAMPELTEVSLTDSRNARREEALQNYLSEFANGPFLLDRGPLLRAALIHMATDDAVFVIVLPHVAADQWALDVFFSDLAACYAATLAEQAPRLPPAASLASFAAARRQWFEAQRESVESAYWIERLRGLEPTTLNEDYVRPAQQNFAGRRLRLEFARRDILALRAFGAAHGATLAMVMLTALQVLLMRHTGKNDVAVGLPIANRQDPASWNLMGTLVNTLVLRTELDPAADFRTALHAVRAAMLEAFEHQDLPFDRLVQELRRERDPGRPALFAVMFNMLNTPLPRVEFPDLRWSRHEFDRKAAQFDLTVTVDAEHARYISFEYATALFAPETIQRLADHYMELLHEIVRDATRPLRELNLIPESELRRLRSWSQGPSQPRAASTIDALIWPSFAQHATQPAVLCGTDVLDYAQLGQTAQRIALGLARLGVGSGSLVGLHLQRSPVMLAALLGALRSGAAYVPLDPEFPTERLAYMARDADLGLILTDGAASSSVAWPESCRCLNIEELLAPEKDGAGAQPAADAARPGDPAYVIYTSGSTGQPKGVVVPHAAVVNFLRSMRERPGLASTDRLLAITTLGFDIAVLELLLPLTVGACIVLARREEQGDGEALGALIHRHHITTLQATPTTWRLLIESGWSGASGLRALVGGETLTGDLANQLLARCAEVWNMYGPTETTVWSACDRVNAPGRERISLGTPIANTGIAVLDAEHGICPIGVPGEICISGDGLALGYLNRPELTAERFIANPHSRDRRARRLYLTGDRGRWRSDGRLEHLGRLDAQLKIRGHRIEPGEIEARLIAHPGVAAAVVVGRNKGDGQTALVAYVVLHGPEHGTRELREYLRQCLPDYMIPQHFVPLPALPLLPNGKLDRQSLPPPRATDALPESSARPRNPTEEALWHVWSQLLQSDLFGIHDNLFDIGGHSLLAAQIANRIRSDLARPCSLALLLRHPTIASLATALDNGPDRQPGSTVVPLQTTGTGPELFCLCGVSLYRELADALAGVTPVCSVFVPAELAMFGGQTDGALATDVPMLARAYLEAIRARQPGGPYRLLGFSFGGVIALEVAQQLRKEGEPVELLAILDSDVPGPASTTWVADMRRTAGRLLATTRRTLRTVFGADRRPDRTMLDAQAYLRTMQRYTPSPYDGATLYVKSVDPPTYDPGYGWELLLQDARTEFIPDSHLGILRNGSVKRLAAALKRIFEEQPDPA